MSETFSSLLVGRTIEMISMNHVDDNPVLPGTRGVVTHIMSFQGDAETNIHVKWETDQVAPIISPIDTFKIVS